MPISKTHRLVESAILLGVSIVLTYLSKLVPLQLPFGGSVTLASMVPVVVLGYKYGFKWGMLSGFVFSILQMMTGFDTMAAYFLPGEGQMLFFNAILITFIDYTLAYTVIGLSGIFKGKFKNPVKELVMGSVVVLLLRYLAHFASGAIFWGSYAEWFFSQGTLGGFGEWVLANIGGLNLSLFYSAFYNGLYMIPETILTAIVVGVLAKTLPKQLGISQPASVS